MRRAPAQGRLENRTQVFNYVGVFGFYLVYEVTYVMDRTAYLMCDTFVNEVFWGLVLPVKRCAMGRPGSAVSTPRWCPSRDVEEPSPAFCQPSGEASVPLADPTRELLR